MTIDLDALEAAVDEGLPTGGVEYFVWLVQLGVEPDALARVLGVVVEECFDDEVPEPRRGVGDVALGAFAIGLVAGRNDRRE